MNRKVDVTVDEHQGSQVFLSKKNHYYFRGRISCREGGTDHGTKR